MKNFPRHFPGFLIAVFPMLLFAQSQNTVLIGQLDYPQMLNDVWGYVADDGTEYALVGMETGVSVVDVTTNPSNPTQVGFVSGQNSTWRDIDTYSHYMYIGTEAPAGIQVVDIQNPASPQLVYTWTGVTNSHTIFEADGYLYIMGASGGNLHILSLANPAQPVQVGVWNGEYLHDIYVRGNYAYGCAINSSEVYVIDVSNKAFPITVTSWNYAGGATHSAWLTDDSQFLITADEMTGGHVKIWDVSNLADVDLVSEWTAPGGSSGSVHNVYVRGDYLYCSYYSLGLQVADISDPYNPILAGYYDTSPGIQGGVWSVYPFTESCYVYASDITNGLFVIEFDGCVGPDPTDPEPPADFSAYSDYTTPASAILSWEDPTALENGNAIGAFVIDVFRDGNFLATVNSAVESYTALDLSDGTRYTFAARARLTSNDSSSVLAQAFVWAGGHPNPSPPTNVQISVSGTTVNFAWLNPSTQADGTPLDDLAGIRIYRDGSVVATVPAIAGQQGMTTDSPSSNFSYVYHLTAIDKESSVNESGPTANVSVWVGDIAAILIWEPLDNSPGSGAAILAAAQALGRSAILTDNLEVFGPPVTAGYDAIFVCLGIYITNHVLNETEAALLVPYLQSGGAIWMEGGDTWAFDEQTSLYPMFHINGTSDGTGDTGTIQGVAGTPFADFSFAYSGENDYMDHLDAGSGATAVFRNLSPNYFNGVAYNSGTYQTIGTSFEFGGLADGVGGTKENLLAAVLDYFDAGGPGGMLGDVDGDGTVSILDITKVVNFILGIPPEPTEEQAWAADMNGDSTIDVFDIILIVDAILDSPPVAGQEGPVSRERNAIR